MAIRGWGYEFIEKFSEGLSFSIAEKAVSRMSS